MDRTNKAFRLLVSQTFIDIAADAIAVHTKKTGRFSTLRSVIEVGSQRLCGSEFDAEDFRAFTLSTALKGEIRVHINMLGSWRTDYEAIKTKLGEIQGRRVFDRIVIAYLLHLSVQNDLF